MTKHLTSQLVPTKSANCSVTRNSVAHPSSLLRTLFVTTLLDLVSACYSNSRANLRAAIGVATLLGLFMVQAAEAGSAGLTVGGYVSAKRVLEIEQQVWPGVSGQGALNFVITAPGNGRAGYELILGVDNAITDAGLSVTFDGRPVDLEPGAAILAVIDGPPGRDPEYRLQVALAPTAGAPQDGETRLRLVLRSR